MSLQDLGWDEFFARSSEEFERQGLIPGRIISVRRGLSLIKTSSGEARASHTGQFTAAEPIHRPIVGDWVVCHPNEGGHSRIEAVLPRKTLLSRKTPGRRTEEQPVAANVDKVFLVAGLDHYFNLRRIERMLTMIYEAGATPVILLNKSDLRSDPSAFVIEVEGIAPGVEVLLASALQGQGMEKVRNQLAPGKTVAFIGSSGVGKSSLINRLFGRGLMPTQAVREDDSRGRHTTSHRELFQHPDGGLLIDNPGIRELQLWASEESLQASFAEIGDLALDCRFRDCSHEGEPGCAVLEAVERGDLPVERLESFRKLQKELRYLAVKQDIRLQNEQKQKWRVIHRALRKKYRERQ